MSGKIFENKTLILLIIDTSIYRDQVYALFETLKTTQILAIKEIFWNLYENIPPSLSKKDKSFISSKSRYFKGFIKKEKKIKITEKYNTIQKYRKLILTILRLTSVRDLLKDLLK